MNSTLAAFIDCHRDALVKTIIADELVDYLPSLKKEDLEAVETAQSNGGKIKGARCLLDRLGRKASLDEFLQGLLRGGYEQLVTSLGLGKQDILDSDGIRKFAARYPVTCEDSSMQAFTANEVNNNMIKSQLPSAKQPQENSHIDRDYQHTSKSFLPPLAEVNGRDDVIGHVTNDLQSDAIFCALVTGSAGFGKTAVAVAVAHRLAAEGRVGTFVSLRSVSTYKGIIQQLLLALQCGVGTGQESPPGQVFQILQHGEGSRLILFDDADEVLENLVLKDKFVELIGKINMIEGIKILITSRHLFKICRMKMSTYKVEELQVDAAVKLLTSKANIDDGIAADLAVACGATPLALEVIASLIKENQSKPEYILTELRRGKMIKLLSPDYLGSSEKVMTCIMTSYRSLDANLRCAFVSIAVFPRSFDTEAAAAVLGLSHNDVRENVLEPLRRRSLLQYDERTERWYMHVLTRAFAREVRDTDPAVSHVSKCETDLHRFCVYFTAFLRGRVLDFAQSTVQCIQRCELERFNILETLHLASKPQFYSEFLPLTGAEAGEKLSPMLAALVPVEDLIEFYKNCLKVAQQHGNLQRELMLICLLGNVYISSINCTFTTLPEGPGEDCVSRALRLIQKLGGQQSSELAQCLRMLGQLEFELLKFQPSMEHLKKALRMQEALQECPSVTATTMIALAKVKLCGLKTPEEASVHLSRAEYMLRDLISKIEIPKLWYLNVILAEAVKMQGHVFLAQNKPEKALTLFEEAYELGKKFTPEHPDNRFAIDGLAHCWLLLDNPQKALELYQKGLSLRKKVCGVEVPVNLKVIAYVHFEMRNVQEALQAEDSVMYTWTQSMKSNGACLRYLTNESTRRFAYTVFYALVGVEKLACISKWLLENPETTREIRIREFASAMWSSGRVTVMQLEPEKYDLALSYIREQVADVIIGEFCATDETGELLQMTDCSELLSQHLASAESKDKCLVIVRPMPPVDRKPLELLPAFCDDRCCSKTQSPASSHQRKFSKICTIL